jgi:hypothetical protein
MSGRVVIQPINIDLGYVTAEAVDLEAIVHTGKRDIIVGPGCGNLMRTKR